MAVLYRAGRRGTRIGARTISGCEPWENGMVRRSAKVATPSVGVLALPGGARTDVALVPRLRERGPADTAGGIVSPEVREERGPEPCEARRSPIRSATRLNLALCPATPGPLELLEDQRLVHAGPNTGLNTWGSCGRG